MQAPSPGTYSYGFSDKESAPKFGFGTAPQRMALGKHDSPGPGGYKVPTKIANRAQYVNTKLDTKFAVV